MEVLLWRFFSEGSVGIFSGGSVNIFSGGPLEILPLGGISRRFFSEDSPVRSLLYLRNLVTVHAKIY